MTAEAVTVRAETPLTDVVRQMSDAHADRIVVFGESDRPIGIVSAQDVLNAVAGSGSDR
jgi:predicted transcriptional regulator